jgi:LmbE family N-acetylglucosaminyl deacetylase
MRTKSKLNILVIIAHHDDAAFACSGTLARWTEEGNIIYMLSVTSSDIGTLKSDITSKELGKLCEKELIAANEEIGIKDTIFLRYPDGGFIDGAKLRKELIYYVRKLEIDRIVTLDPWQKYEVHPDHIIVGRMAAEAAAFSAFPLLYKEQLQEGLNPYQCSEVWFMGRLGHAPNYYVDISSTFEKKITHILKFESTFILLSELFAPDIDPRNVTQKEMKKLKKLAKKLLNSMASVLGKEVGLKTAEAFFVQKTLPGHFDNFRDIFLEMLGHPQKQPKII